MKDGRTHLAHKAEHAVDLATGAVLAVTLRGADEGDAATRPAPPLDSESRPQLKAFAHGGAEVGVGFGRYAPRRDDQSSHMNIVLNTESVWLGLYISPKIVFERVQVFLCPDDFEPRSV
jgi:hypothetical protein